ncbi:MAG: hypothetical protein IT373_07160 [Polyangiaceae bacterium]|nr:hypothetical protein [Polyangiaceae bacterium]
MTCGELVCDPHASCGAGPNGAACTCDPGYTGNGTTCTDIDECASAPCGPGTCVNEPGSYSCNCNLGYEEQNGTCVAADECTVANGGCAAGCTCADTPGASPVCSCVLSHSSSSAIVAANSVACNYSGLENADNSYYRVYDLAAFGIDGDFAVSSVSIGIEQATGGAGSQPATLRLHRLNGAMQTSNFTTLTTAPITIFDAAATVVSFPVSGTAQAGTQLVVELNTPDAEFLGHLFFIGSNTAAETGPSYLRAPTCGFTEPTTSAAIGYPGMHIVLDVEGSYSPP